MKSSLTGWRFQRDAGAAELVIKSVICANGARANVSAMAGGLESVFSPIL